MSTPRPTYHMYEEIRSQPGHLLALGEAVARGADAASAVLAGKTPILTGCGTSQYAAELAASYLTERGAEVSAVGAFPLLQRQAPLDRRRPIVALSHSGETPAVLDLLQSAHERDVPTVLITGFPGSAGARLATATVASGYARELSLCHTISFTLSSLTALLLLKATAAQLPPGLLLPDLRELAAGIDALLAREGEVARRAKALLAPQRVVVGAAEGLPLAREVGLKLSEAAYLASPALELELFFHGYIPAYAPGDHILAVLPPAAGTRGEDLRRVAQVMDMGLTVVDLPTLRTFAPDLSPECFPWVAGVYLQLLTYHAALLRGTDPDRLRREDPRYLAARKAYR